MLFSKLTFMLVIKLQCWGPCVISFYIYIIKRDGNLNKSDTCITLLFAVKSSVFKGKNMSSSATMAKQSQPVLREVHILQSAVLYPLPM